MPIARLIVGIPIGGAITLGLFILMMELISTDAEPAKEEEVASIDFQRIKRDEELRTKDRDLERPKKVEQPPPPPPVDLDLSKDVNKDRMSGLNVGANVNVNFQGTGAGTVSDGDVLPLVRVAPIYPSRAASRGIEGWVDVRFNISKTGTVMEPVTVIAGQPSGTFDRAAIKAVRKWKYKPKIVNGEPQERYGVEVRLTFQLDD